MCKISCNELGIREYVDDIATRLYDKLVQMFSVEVIDSPPIGSKQILLNIAPVLYRYRYAAADVCLEYISSCFVEHILLVHRDQKTIYVYLPKIYRDGGGRSAQSAGPGKIPMRIVLGQDINTGKSIVWLCAQIFSVKEN